MRTALLRSWYGGFLIGSSNALVMYAATNSLKPAIVAGLTTFVGYCIARGGVEGYIDTRSYNQSLSVKKD